MTRVVRGIQLAARFSNRRLLSVEPTQSQGFLATLPVHRQSRGLQGSSLGDLGRASPVWRKKLGVDELNEEMMPKRSKAGAKSLDMAYLQILGMTEDCGPSVYLFTSTKRYLFNCGEGTQRLFTQHKVRLRGLSQIFITKMDWEYVGGLTGFLITLRDTFKNMVNVHGPAGLRNVLYAARHFIGPDRTKCNFHETKNEDVFDDGTVTMVAYRVQSSRQLPASPSVPSDADEEGVSSATPSAPNHSTGSPEPSGSEPASKRRKTDEREDRHMHQFAAANTVYCYVGNIVESHGTMNVERAKALGVPVGPLLGELKRGNPVVLPNGERVSPEQVLDKPEPNNPFAIIHCPDDSFVAGLRTTKMADRFNAKGVPGVVLHMTSLELMTSPQYKEFVDQFAEGTNHILMDPSKSHVQAFSSAANHQAILSAVDPSVFRVPYQDVGLADDAEAKLQATFKSAHFAKPLHRFGILGGQSTQADDELCRESLIDFEGIRKDAQTRAGLERRETELDTDASSTAQVEAGQSSGPQSLLTFFGTGSAVPSKYRNVTGMLLELPAHPSAWDKGAAVDQSGDPLPLTDRAFIATDCGEGSYGQLFRRFGPDTDEVLARLACIHISHNHADHHLGLFRLLFKREEAVRKLGIQAYPVVVVAPRNLSYWLYEYQNFQYVPVTFMHSNRVVQAEISSPSTPKPLQRVMRAFGFSRWSNPAVVHCSKSTGLVLEHLSGWKYAWTGDCRPPCPEFVEAAKNCNLLVHEATFNDDLLAEAKSKFHSTTSEALDVGQQLGAAFTMLTHFSQRYPKLPDMSDANARRAGVAFDLMTVNIHDCSALPGHWPRLQRLFDTVIAEEEDYNEA